MARPNKPMVVKSTAPLTFLIWPNYASPRDVLGPLVELGRLVECNTARLFFHDDTLDVPAIRAHLDAARRHATVNVAADSIVCGDARAESGSSFAALLCRPGDMTPEKAALCERLGLAVVTDRFDAERLCIEHGVVARQVERSFCTKPWRHLHIEADGVATPCCVAPIEERTPSLANHRLADVYNSASMRRVRLNMLAGIRDGACHDCWDSEDRGDNSFRELPEPLDDEVAATRAMTREDGGIPEDKIAPIDVDIRWSNICNFKCRMCWHRSSSSWFEDSLQMHRVLTRQPADVGPSHEEQEKQTLVWGDKPLVSFNSGGGALDKLAPYLGRVTNVYSAGGEPLMMEEHFEFLEYLRPRAAEICLSYNTNLSRLDYKGRDLLAIWEPFKQVHVLLSVDGFGGVGEYVRTGFRTDRFVGHLLTLRDGAKRTPNLTYGVAITVSSYNLFHVPTLIRELLAKEYVDGSHQIFLGWVRLPWRASPFAMPRALRESAAQEYERLLTAVDCDPREEGGDGLRTRATDFIRSLRRADDGLFTLHRDDVWVWLEQLDKLRSTSWRAVVPHMASFEPDHE